MYLKFNLKKFFKYAVSIISLLVIAKVASIFIPAIWYVNAKFCEKPLHFKVQVISTGYKTDITDSYLRSTTEKAIQEWNTALGINLFELSDKKAESKIIVTPKSLEYLSGYNVPIATTSAWRNKHGAIASASIEIFTSDEDKLYIIILHELAHTVGMLQHSDSDKDVMFAEYNSKTTKLTARDIQLVRDHCNAYLRTL